MLRCDRPLPLLALKQLRQVLHWRTLRVLHKLLGLDTPEDQLQAVEHEHIVRVELHPVGLRRERVEELEVCELVELHKQLGLQLADGNKHEAHLKSGQLLLLARR